jgi:hypothetical protein
MTTSPSPQYLTRRLVLSASEEMVSINASRSKARIQLTASANETHSPNPFEYASSDAGIASWAQISISSKLANC